MCICGLEWSNVFQCVLYSSQEHYSKQIYGNGSIAAAPSPDGNIKRKDHNGQNIVCRLVILDQILQVEILYS